MKKDKGMKKLAAKASAIAMSIFMTAAMSVPVWADVTATTDVSVTSATSEDGEHSCVIRFMADGNEIARFYANAGDTYGPDGTISVRSTYYDQATGKDYDVAQDDYEGTVGDRDSEIDIQYKEHEAAENPSSTYYCIASDTGAIIAQVSSEADLKNEITSGDITYKRNGSKPTPDENDSSAYDVIYTPYESTVDHYTFTVKYVTSGSDGTEKVLATRTFNVNGKTTTFYAPKVFSSTSDGVTTYYEAIGDTKITKEPDDPEREATIEYKTQTEDNKPYTWYILFYNAQTNRCFDSKEVEVTADAGATFTPENSITINGTNYTINKAFQKTYTQAYKDTNHVSYIYYDPEGYNNSSEIQKKNINIQYVDIATGNVLQSTTQEVTSSGDTTISFPDSLDKDDVHYLRVQGQVASVDYNFYSPKETYTVYYYDENNTEFRTSVITTEEVQEVTVTDGTTTYRVIPGITRTIVTNTDNGVSTVVATNDSTGAAIVPTPAGNIQLNSDNTENTDGSDGTSVTDTSAAGAAGGDASSDDDSQDVSIDGVQADNIQTPESNIWLDSKADNSSATKKAVLLIIGIAALAACVIATILLIRRIRRSNKR